MATPSAPPEVTERALLAAAEEVERYQQLGHERPRIVRPSDGPTMLFERLGTRRCQPQRIASASRGVTTRPQGLNRAHT
jgi:hypothetical protein